MSYIELNYCTIQKMHKELSKYLSQVSISLQKTIAYYHITFWVRLFFLDVWKSSGVAAYYMILDTFWTTERLKWETDE